MQNTYNIYIKSIAVTFVIAMLFSCKGKLNEVRSFELLQDGPQAIGQEINLFYTDSGKVVANLKSAKLKDYSNQEFPYREFPDGLTVDFFDDSNKKNTVYADYGIIYEPTGLIDLQGNVKIVTSDSTIVYAEQLYYDQQKQWVFTDQPYTALFPSGSTTNGEGFDSNKGFTKFLSRSDVGVMYLEEEEK
jgi:LPS export ABC transporter protein LptC